MADRGQEGGLGRRRRLGDPSRLLQRQLLALLLVDIQHQADAADRLSSRVVNDFKRQSHPAFTLGMVQANLDRGGAAISLGAPAQVHDGVMVLRIEQVEGFFDLLGWRPAGELYEFRRSPEGVLSIVKFADAGLGAGQCQLQAGRRGAGLVARVGQWGDVLADAEHLVKTVRPQPARPVVHLQMLPVPGGVPVPHFRFRHAPVADDPFTYLQIGLGIARMLDLTKDL